jgi:hypothetical protein
VSKSSTPKVARGKTGKENTNAASKIRARKTNKTKPESAPSAAAKPHEKGRKTATQKMVSAQRRDSHRKAAPIAVAVVPKAVVEKPRDSHRKAAPIAVAALPKDVVEEARDTHHKATSAAAPAGPKSVAERPRDTHHKATPAQFEKPRDSQVPDTMRALAERNVAQTRALYERSKNTLEAVLDSCEKSFGVGGQGAVALNLKIIDIAERNINTGFDLAMSLAGAKNFAEVVELQAAYWRKLFGELQTQAKEVRALSTKVTDDVTKPIKDA